MKSRQASEQTASLANTFSISGNRHYRQLFDRYEQNVTTQNGSNVESKPNGLAPQQQSAPNKIFGCSTEDLWGKPQCDFSKSFKYLNDKDTSPCSSIECRGEACKNCQQTKPFFIRLRRSREIPASDVSKLERSLLNQSFPLPDGNRLLVFSTEEEANNSRWRDAPFSNGTSYMVNNESYEKSICFHVCKACKRCEIRPIPGRDPSLFCSEGTNYQAALLKAEKKPSPPSTSAVPPNYATRNVHEANFDRSPFIRVATQPDDHTAYDRLQQSEARVARFATGRYGGRNTAASFGMIKGG